MSEEKPPPTLWSRLIEVGAFDHGQPVEVTCTEAQAPEWRYHADPYCPENGTEVRSSAHWQRAGVLAQLPGHRVCGCFYGPWLATVLQLDEHEAAALLAVGKAQALDGHPHSRAAWRACLATLPAPVDVCPTWEAMFTALLLEARDRLVSLPDPREDLHALTDLIDVLGEAGDRAASTLRRYVAQIRDLERAGVPESSPPLRDLRRALVDEAYSDLVWAVATRSARPWVAYSLAVEFEPSRPHLLLLPRVVAHSGESAEIVAAQHWDTASTIHDLIEEAGGYEDPTDLAAAIRFLRECRRP